MTIFEEIREILVGQLAIKPALVRTESKLSNDLGADSLDALEIVSALEGKFGINITEDEVPKISSVGDLVTLVDEKLRSKTS